MHAAREEMQLDDHSFNVCMGRRTRSARIRKRRWCFTLNNYTAEEEEAIQTYGGECLYLCYGREIGESGTPHLQGFFIRENAVSLKSLKRFNKRAHWEAAKGNSVQASEYCKKDGDVWECGTTPVKPGARTDLDTIREEILGGAKELQVANDHFGKWCVYRRSFGRYRELINPPRRRLDLDVHVLVGYTGVGKTRFVHQAAEHHGEEVWISGDPELKWFDGYRGEKWVLLDDFRGGCPFEFLLRLLDVYKLRVQVKGSYVAWNPETIFITSNLDPTVWYSSADCAPLLRRLTKVVHVSAVEASMEWDELFLALFEKFGY